MRTTMSSPSPMRRFPRQLLPLLWLLPLSCLLVACSGVSSTTRRAGQVGAGSAVGGLAGYVAGKGKPLAVAGGAVAGALVTDLALGADPEVEQRGFDQGYIQGQSDAIKRQYFLRQAMEERPLRTRRERSASYYLPAPALSPEGAKQQPPLLELRVKE